MDAKITISQQEYEKLKSDSDTWRRFIGEGDETVIFNAWRDNNGEGVEAGKMANILRKLIEEEEEKDN